MVQSTLILSLIHIFKELKNGTLAAELQAKTKELTSRIEEKEQAAGRLRDALALNIGVVLFLIILTILFGRIYCSVICPLGVFQDAIFWELDHVRVDICQNPDFTE